MNRHTDHKNNIGAPKVKKIFVGNIFFIAPCKVIAPNRLCFILSIIHFLLFLYFSLSSDKD